MDLLKVAKHGAGRRVFVIEFRLPVVDPLLQLGNGVVGLGLAVEDRGQLEVVGEGTGAEG